MNTKKFQGSELQQMNLLTIQEVADWPRSVRRPFIDGFQTVKFPPFGLEIEHIVFQKKRSLII